MKPGNFNWFLHANHTKHVINGQKRKAKSQEINNDDEDLGLDEEPVESNISESEFEL